MLQLNPKEDSKAWEKKYSNLLTPNANRYNDGYSVMVNDGYELPDHMYQAMGARLGGRNLQSDDAKLKIDRIKVEELIESQGPHGPPCFGPRIMKEPPVPNFQLARGTKTYDGSTKLENWLIDYGIVVKTA